MPFLFAAALLLGDTPTDEAELTAFWTWFEELLEGRDPGLHLINQGSGLNQIPRRFGFLLSRLPHPDDLLRSTYEKLEPQRRRGLSAHRYRELYVDLESVVLLLVGLHTATNWNDREKVGERAQAARQLFFWIV